MNIFGTFNFYLKRYIRITKFLLNAKRKNVHLAKGLSGGENSPREEAGGGLGLAGHLQAGPGGMPGGGGGPEGLVRAGPYYFCSQVSYTFLKPPLPFYSVKGIVSRYYNLPLTCSYFFWSVAVARGRAAWMLRHPEVIFPMDR